jgi:hypothetical protein
MAGQKSKGAKNAAPERVRKPASGSGRLRERALGPAADEFGKELAPLGKEVGEVSLKVGRMLLRPIQGLVGGLERIGAWLGDAITKRLKNVPEDKIVAPDPRIAVPAVQALVYSIDDEFIRDMFANLLAADMNADAKGKVHPAFVEIIKEMTSADAKVLEAISRNISVQFRVQLGTLKFWNTIGTEYSFAIDGVDSQRCTNSVSNLQRLGLIGLTRDTVDQIESMELPEVLLQKEEAVLRKYDHMLALVGEKRMREKFGENSGIYVVKYGMGLTPLGYQFQDVCLPG